MIKSIKRIGLIYQIGLVVLVGFAISFLLSMHLLSSEKSKSLSFLSSTGAIQRVLSVIDILGQTPKELHNSIIRASSGSDLSLSLTTTPNVTIMQGDTREIAILSERLKSAGINTANLSLVKHSRPILNMNDMHNAMMSGMSMQDMRDTGMSYVATIDGSVQLRDNSWLNFSSGIQEDITHWSASVLTALTLVMLVTLSLSLFIIHRSLRPIRILGKAATEFAINKKVTVVSDKCPSDLHPTISAFNKMQVDISEFIEERTRLLAAISHDLRTPLTSLRLRLEFIDDTENKTQMLKSVSIMEKMLKATMSFAKEDNQREQRQSTDINSLLQTIVDEYADKGIPIEYKDNINLVESVPPVTIRRMIENLVNNSVQYGGDSCEITLSVIKRTRLLEFSVADNGVGIDSAKIEEMMKPFSRMDSARDTEGSNVGLGLSITKALANNFGGDLVLKGNHPTGLISTFTIAVN